MKKYLIVPIAILALVVSSKTVSAHEHQIFKINGKYYQFTVGSLNEPIAVDDKTGVDLRVELVTEEHATEKHDDSMPHTEEKFPAVAGLDKTLKVELGAGEKTKVLDLVPAYNDPGAYRAYFMPTVQTTYSYRFFGSIDNTPVSLTFSCNPAGHTQSDADMNVVKISNNVERVSKVGVYGCPVGKADLGFPEQSASLVDLKAQASEAQAKAGSTRSLAIAGLVLGVLGFVAAGGAWVRRRPPQS